MQATPIGYVVRVLLTRNGGHGTHFRVHEPDAKAAVAEIQRYVDSFGLPAGSASVLIAWPLFA